MSVRHRSRRTTGRPPTVLTASTRQRRRSRVPAVLALAVTVALVALAVSGVGPVDDLLDDPAAGGAPVAAPAVPVARGPEGGGAVPPETPAQEALGPLPSPESPEALGLPAIDLRQRATVGVKLPAPPRAGLAFDVDTGEVLWRRGATRRASIASLTKLMTALVAVDALGPDDRVRVPAAAPAIRGSQMGGLVAGRRARTEVLLAGLMIASGNDAAIALATGVAGSQRAFVLRMNARARDLGLRCTRYVDPHGLGAGNRSCPADLAVLAMRAMAEPRIAAVARKSRARVWPGAGEKRLLLSTNPLLQRRYPGALGLKTGYTPAAGRCLVSIVRRGGRRIGIVLLGSPDPGLTTRRILHRVTGI